MAAAATRIQAAWRGARARRRWRALRRAVAAAQARARGCAARRRFLVLRGAAVALQACRPSRQGCGPLCILTGLGCRWRACRSVRRPLSYGLPASPALAPASQPAERRTFAQAADAGRRAGALARARGAPAAARAPGGRAPAGRVARALRTQTPAARAGRRDRAAGRLARRARAPEVPARARLHRAGACPIDGNPAAGSIKALPSREVWCCRSLRSRAPHDLLPSRLRAQHRHRAHTLKSSCPTPRRCRRRCACARSAGASSACAARRRRCRPPGAAGGRARSCGAPRPPRRFSGALLAGMQPLWQEQCWRINRTRS